MKFRAVYVNDSAFDSMVRIVDVDDDDRVFIEGLPAIDAMHYIEYLNFRYNIMDDNG